jgi:hypothetical protein
MRASVALLGLLVEARYGRALISDCCAANARLPGLALIVARPKSLLAISLPLRTCANFSEETTPLGSLS